MSRPDPFELLGAADPVPDASGLHLPRGVADDVVAGRDPSPRRRRRRTAALAGVVVLGVSAVAAAAFVARRQPATTISVGCYAEARLDAHTAVVATEPGGAVETCAQLWREGHIGSGPVPPLQACVLREGAIGVFPGADPSVCAGLGNNTAPAPAPEDITPPGDADGDVLALRSELAAADRGVGCLAPDDARAIAGSALRRHGFPAWKIEIGAGASGKGFDDERPCATFQVNEERQVVLLVPFPRR
ncbi:MAG: hypothetical protein KY443_07750 [Actinobacteria bacterium]|nr:hypothetical protein [Actinomycetota bacterium]